MSAEKTGHAPLAMEEKLRRAQEAYREFYLQCFWSAPENLVVTEDNVPIVIEGLKLDGGHRGWTLALTLCRYETRIKEGRFTDACFRFK